MFGIITGILTTEAVHWGFGRHIYYLTPEQLAHAIKWSYITAPFAFMSLVFGRVSFAVSLIVIIGTKKWRRWLLWFVIVSQFIVNLILIGVGFGVCTPAHKYWDRKTPGTCLNPSIHRNLGYAQGGMHNTIRFPVPLLTPSLAFNVFADLVLAVLPASVISNLNLKMKIKVGLVALMSLGIL